MPARKDALDFSVFNIDGSTLLAHLRSFDFEPNIMAEDGKGIAARYGTEVRTKRENRFTATLVRDSSGRKTNLDISVFTVGASALVGQLKGGSFEYTNVLKDGSGVLDFDTFPNATATHYSAEGRLQVTTNAELIKLLANSITGADFEVVVQITLGGITINCPMLMKGGGHSIQPEEIQEYRVTFGPRGTPTAPTGSASLFAKGIASDQTGAVVLRANTGGNQYGEVIGGDINALIASGKLSFEDAAIIKEDYGFWVQDRPNVIA